MWRLGPAVGLLPEPTPRPAVVRIVFFFLFFSFFVFFFLPLHFIPLALLAAHPFLHHNKDRSLGKLPIKLEENSHYQVDDKGRFFARIPQNYDSSIHNTFAMGQAIQKESDLNISFKQDCLPDFNICCRFRVSQIPVWFNDKTISPEPFIIDDLGQNQKMTWGIDYCF